jgi:hypothetical protein
MCFLVLDFGLNIVLSLTCPESLPWHCSEFYFLALNFCLDIISSVLPCLGSFLWHCLKFASLFWTLALTLFWVLLVLNLCLDIVLSFTSLSWIFALTLFQVCFLILDLCFDTVSSLLPCLGSLLWYCFKCASLSWLILSQASQMCFLVLKFGFDIVLSPTCPESLPWHCLKFASLSWIFVLTLFWVLLFCPDGDYFFFNITKI